MEKFALSGKVILLFESYSPESRLLHESLLQTNYDLVVVSLEENDFLPRNILSIYDLLCSDYRTEKDNRGEPKYFNEVAVPDNWSIQSGYAGNKQSGSIIWLNEEKGKIYYSQTEKKFSVEAVDWNDRKGRVRFRDHYNRYGNICARTVFDINGKPYCKTRFSAAGQEIITENYWTGDLIFNHDGVVQIFRNRLDLMLYWLAEKGIRQNRIFYNSLSTPFFISHRLGIEKEKTDVLFWQEPVGQEIPGNMRVLLNENGRTGKIVVQKRSSYEKLLSLGVDSKIVKPLGFIYPFRKENGHKPEALICTNSDNIEHCRELIMAFPQMHFHIAAITTMSSRLMELEAYENVSLYPGATEDIQKELFQKCDFYFDINHQSEIISAVYQAFLHNHLIFAFQETLHNREYVAQEQIYPVAEFERMVSDISAVLEDEKVMGRRLEKQREYAMAETKETYVEMLGL